MGCVFSTRDSLSSAAVNLPGWADNALTWICGCCCAQLAPGQVPMGTQHPHGKHVWGVRGKSMGVAGEAEGWVPQSCSRGINAQLLFVLRKIPKR